MAVNIKIKVDVDKAVEKSLDNITKRLEGVSKGMESIVKKMEVGFKGVGDGLNEMLMKLADVDSLGGLKQVEQAMVMLQTAFKNNKITLEQYLPLMDKLTAKYNELSVSATKAAASTKTGGSLPTDAINAARNGGMINFVDKMDATNLQQIIALSKQELGLVSTVGEKRERLAKQLELSKATLKNMTLTDRQRAEIADKQLRVEEKKTQQLEKQALASRRANASEQYTYAMGMQANTLPQIIAKTNELKIAKDNLNKSDKEQAAQIGKVNRELEQLKIKEDQINKTGLSLVDTNQRSSRSFSELAQIAGAYFSVYAIKNFAMEMANVTGEFDLQRRSLQALLQDRQAADAIFEKIKATAVQSPFSVMQLTSATKQLAAYRIEADNLFDTTMMLSDISAGLGVEMERLILAFGQVKAATVLRGQEVRQFTESGIPIISLLADKFSELENRAVSTGEVFDKISNRLVPFEMINEIFQDMTSNGGIFFEMQKIQAETIKGKIVNLTDAYQIFLDKMGSANSGIIKGFIGLLEGMLRNMDSILPILKGLVAGLITYKVAMFGLNVATGQNILLQKLKIIQDVREALGKEALTYATVKATLAAKGLNSAFIAAAMTNPWVAIATAITAVATAIGFAAYNAGKFNRELDKISEESTANVDSLYRTFVRLVSVMKDNTKSVSQQNDAYEELKRTFKDILPAQLLEISNLKSEKLAYDDVKAAIYAKIAAQREEKKLTALEENVGSKLSENEKDLVDDMVSGYGISKDLALDYIKKMKEIIDTTGDSLKAWDYLEKQLPKRLLNMGFKLPDLNNFLGNYKKYQTTLKEITDEASRDADGVIQKYGNTAGAEFNKKIQHLGEIVQYYENFWGETSDKFAYNRQQQVIAHQKRYLEQQIAELEKTGGVTELKMAQDLRKELKKILGDDDQRDIQAKLEQLANQFGVSFDKIRLYLKTDQQGFGEWGETINNVLEQRIENLKRYKEAEDKTNINIKNLLGGVDLKAYEAETKFLLRVQDFYKLKKKDSEGSANSKDPLLNAIKEEISLIEKLTNQYKLLLKEGYSIDKAKETVGVSFKENIDAINNILSGKGLEPLKFEDLFQGDPNAVLNLFTKQLEKLKGNKEASKLLSDQVGELKVKIDIAKLDETENEIKQFLEDIKRKYELSLEINDAPSLSRDVLMKMFGLNESDILKNIGELIDKVNEKIREKLKEQGVQGTDNVSFNELTTEQFNAYLEPFKSKEGYGDIAKGLIDLFNLLQDKQKQYVDNSAKAYQELLRKYADFNDQRTLVAENGDKELRTLDEQFATDELKRTDKYLKLKKAIANKTAKEIAAINYEELKVSDEYINMFDRIDIMSEGNMVESYGKVRQGIVDAFESGTISLRTFKSSLAELDNQFKDFYMQTGNFVAYLQGGFDGLFKNMSETSYNIQAIASKINQTDSNGDPVKFFTAFSKDDIDYLAKNGTDINQLAKETNFSTKAAASNLGKAASGMSQVAAKGASAAMWVQLIVQNIYGAIKGINELRAAFDRLRESQGRFVNQYTTENDKFWTALGNFNETAMHGFEQLKSGNILGALATTIRSYVDIASDFNELSDKQIQEKIEDTTDSIDRLNDSLDRLQTQVDKQLGSDWLSGMNQIAEGYGQMAEDTQANIDNMKSMKNPDEDAIYAEEQKLLDYQQKQRDIIDEMVEEMTGSDLKSAAEDFAQIWIDAFLAGEDAMAALEERFKDMINNMIVKAIASKVVAGIMKRTFDAVEAAVNPDGEGGSGITQGELELINDEGKAGIQLVNEELGKLGEWFSQMLGIGGSGETLQKGIQGVTEQTAGIIEGYLNTIRFEIFKHTNVLQGIQTQMQMNNNISSDILYQATLSYQVLVAIRDWQTSITTLDNGLPAIRVV